MAVSRDDSAQVFISSSWHLKCYRLTLLLGARGHSFGFENSQHAKSVYQLLYHKCNNVTCNPIQ